MNVQERFRNRYFGPQGIVEGIRLCISLEHSASALGLICAAIESMTFLALPHGRDAIYDLDFIQWVDTYLRPHKVGIGGNDLWATRCALLEKRISQQCTNAEGRPREVLFAWGGYTVYASMELRPGSRWHRIMRIHADELYKAIFRGAEQFSSAYISSPEHSGLVDKRLNQVFGRKTQ